MNQTLNILSETILRLFSNEVIWVKLGDLQEYFQFSVLFDSFYSFLFYQSHITEPEEVCSTSCHAATSGKHSR